MAKIKSLSLENEGIRQIVSAEQVYEMPEINIFESKMTQAAEYLFKEIKSEAKLYIKLFWSGTDDNDIARKVLAYVPDDFSGNVLLWNT